MSSEIFPRRASRNWFQKIASKTFSTQLNACRNDYGRQTFPRTTVVSWDQFFTENLIPCLSWKGDLLRLRSRFRMRTETLWRTILITFGVHLKRHAIL